jgi:hypothetical protein
LEGRWSFENNLGEDVREMRESEWKVNSRIQSGFNFKIIFSKTSSSAEINHPSKQPIEANFGFWRWCIAHPRTRKLAQEHVDYISTFTLKLVCV